MKPAIRWVLAAVFVIAAIAALSVRAMKSSPVTPPLGAPTTDGGTTGGVDAGDVRTGVTGSGQVMDGGVEQPRLQPYPAGVLREEEVAFQIALLPVKRSISSPTETVRRIAKREFPGLQIITRPDTDTPAPSVYVSDTKVPGISFREVTLFGRDLDHNTRVALAHSKRALVLEFHLKPDASYDELRRAHRLAHGVAAPPGAAIFDGETHEYFSAKEWRLRRIDSWGQQLPQAPLLISIQTAAVPGGYRSVTFGMAKFGLPDILISRHPQHLGPPLATLINLVAQTLVERGALPEEGKLSLEVAALQEPVVREEMLKLIRGNAKGAVTLTVALTAPQESDPQNRLMELSFPGEDPAPAQDAAIRSLFGP